MIDMVVENHSMRIQTGVLNEIMTEAVAMQQPPADKGKRLKLFYMTQVAVKPPTFVIFVNDKEVLGPLVLDKLYKSGFTNFPVIDIKGKVKGVIHTEALNTLEIKKTDLAEKYIDKSVNYLHANDSLQVAVEEIVRTNGYYFLVLDKNESLVGFFTIQMLLDYLIG